MHLLLLLRAMLQTHRERFASFLSRAAICTGISYSGRSKPNLKSSQAAVAPVIQSLHHESVCGTCARWRAWASQLYTEAAARLPLSVRRQLVRLPSSQPRGKPPPPATVVALILPDPSPDAAADAAKLAAVVRWCGHACQNHIIHTLVPIHSQRIRNSIPYYYTFRRWVGAVRPG